MSTRGPSPAPSRTSPGTPARWLARIAAAFAVLLLLVLGLSFWLLRTESGLGFVLARAVGATDGKLEIGASSGRLSGPVTLDAVQAWCRAELAPYKVPAGLTFVAALPRNEIGKVLRQDLIPLARRD